MFHGDIDEVRPLLERQNNASTRDVILVRAQAEACTEEVAQGNRSQHERFPKIPGKYSGGDLVMIRNVDITPSKYQTRELSVTIKQSGASSLMKQYNSSSAFMNPYLSRSQNTIIAFKKKKVLFDDTKFRCSDSEPALKGGAGLSSIFRTFSCKDYFFSNNTSLRPGNMVFFCDWYPQLFGIDEEEIPSSEDEEGLFDIDWDDLEDKTDALVKSDLSNSTDEQLKEAWNRNQIPKYGRRARQKPILEKDNKKFECICDIDKKYSRHYIRHFDGGLEREGEELKTPHFKAFWENFKEKADMADLNQSSNLFEKTAEEPEDEKKEMYRFSPTFPSSVPREMEKFREQIWATFRPLDCREVRRYRMSYAEALYLELQEDLYLDSAAFFKYLVLKDHFMHETADRSSVRLRNNRPLINKLVTFLKLAEKLSRRKEYHKEAIVLLRSGKYFNDHDENWWWLAEELYTKAVKVSQKSVIDGGKAEAIANYILGTFLLDCVGRMQLAQEHLLKARELSLGKDWNAGRILNKIQDPLYQECASHLCRALIAVSKELRKSGKPEQALPLIHRSHKLCKESKNPKLNIEMETYFELGMTYQEVGMLDWAKIAFRKFIEIAKTENYARSICEGFLELAICFRSEGDLYRCHHHLLSYLNTAEAHENENLIAFANRYLGEFYLNSGNVQAAEVHFQKAFLSFLQQCAKARDIPFNEWQPEHFSLLQDVELTRALKGLATGVKLTKTIFYLIMKGGNVENQKEIQMFINWKNFSRDRSPEIYNNLLEMSEREDLFENISYGHLTGNLTNESAEDINRNKQGFLETEDY